MHNYPDKYINTQGFNKLTAEHFTARLIQANLGNKSNTANFVKQKDFGDKLKNLNKKITSNKNELNELSKKVKQYQQKD